MSLVVLGLAGSFGAAPATAAATVLHVDGKHGNDANDGRTWADAVKTIYRAAQLVPHGSAAGWTVLVRGYTDHVYAGRPAPGGYDRWGSAASPLVFQAEGWTPGGGGYVRPIVSGGRRLPTPGNTWTKTAWARVWSTPLASAPRGFDAGKPYQGALFQGTTSWVVQRASLAELRATAGDGRGGYWYDGATDRVYLVAKGGVDPRTVGIEIPHDNGFYFSGRHGAKYIEVRGFEVRHAAMGIAFVEGTDHSTAVDNVVTANSPVGIHTAGIVTASGVNAAVGNRILRNDGSYNTVQAIKVGAGSQATTACDNDTSHNGLQGIKVEGPDGGAADPRVTSDTLVCRHRSWGQNVRQLEDANDNGTGITIESGALRTRVENSSFWRNHVGVKVMQRTTAGLPVDDTVITHNRIWDNDRFGLSFRDGVLRAASGSGRVIASYNLYWANEAGIGVDPGSVNKVFRHETVYASSGAGIKVGCGCSSREARVTITSSLVTHNGTVRRVRPARPSRLGVIRRRAEQPVGRRQGLGCDAHGGQFPTRRVSQCQRGERQLPQGWPGIVPVHGGSGSLSDRRQLGVAGSPERWSALLEGSLGKLPTMGPMYGFVVLLHVLGAFTFVAAHGVSMVAAVRLRGERDRVRQVALLDVSAAGVGLMYVGLLVLLVGGIVAGFVGNHWGRVWIWAALVTLVVVIVVMYAVATPFYGRMRAAAGIGQ